MDLKAGEQTASRLKKQAKASILSLPDGKPKQPYSINEDIPDMKDVEQRIAALKKRKSPSLKNAPLSYRKSANNWLKLINSDGQFEVNATIVGIHAIG